MQPVTKKDSTSRLSSSTSGPSPESVKVGYVRRAHGIKGAVIVRVLGDETAQFAVGNSITTDNTDHPKLTVSAAQPHKDGLLVVFEGVADRNLAETMRGTSFFVMPADRRQLDDDEYWPEQLVGLRVVDPEGNDIGSIVDLVAEGAQGRLMVKTDAGVFPVPFVAALVPEVNVVSGSVVVDAPEGLFEP